MYHLLHQSVHDRPDDALDQSASVLRAIEGLIAGSEDLHQLRDIELSGLCIILRAVSDAMQDAARSFNEQTARGTDRPVETDQHSYAPAGDLETLVADLRAVLETAAPAKPRSGRPAPNLTEEAPTEDMVETEPKPSTAKRKANG